MTLTSLGPAGYPTPSESTLLPFEHERVPVISSIADFQRLREQHPHLHFGLHVGYKDKAGWDQSTSPDFMNKALPGCVHVPFNISPDDFSGLEELLAAAQADDGIVSLNFIHPHKNSNIVRRFLGVPPSENVDNAVKEDGKLVPYDNNGPAFAQYYDTEVNPGAGIDDADVYLVGAGAAGSAIARYIDMYGRRPARITIIDKQDRSELVAELMSRGVKATSLSPDDPEYLAKIQMQDNVTIINAAGPDGVATCSPLLDLLSKR